jgi:hypothetical protein
MISARVAHADCAAGFLILLADDVESHQRPNAASVPSLRRPTPWQFCASTAKTRTIGTVPALLGGVMDNLLGFRQSIA